MAATFISIMLLMVARHHPPSRRKIKEIWHGRVYWEGESNTTMLRSSPEKVTEVRESSTNLDKFTPPKITVTPPGQHLCWNAGNVFVTGHKAFDRTVSDYGGSRIIKFPKGTIPLKVKWEQHATIAWFTCEGHPYHFLHETLGPIVASLSGHEGPTRILVFSDAKVDSLKLMSERTFCHADHLLNMLLAWSQIRTDLWTTNGYSSIHSLKPNTESRDLSEVTCFRKWDVVKPNKWPTDMLPTVLRWAGCVSRNNRRRVVIIQRAHRGRKITNIDAIVQMYGDMVGFNSVEVVQFETLTLKEQLLKFCGSHILLVGIHGGGLAWGSLLGSQSSLIEIGYKEWGRASKPQYASRYKGQFILAGNPVKKSGNPKFYNISVNVKKLRKESMMILDIHPTKRVVTPSVQLEDARSPMQKAQPHLKTKTMIAICAATHSKSNWRSLDDTALQNILIPSIEKTISTSDRSKYDFRLYLAADHDDHFWLQNQNNVKTPDWLQVEIGFYEVPEQKIPFNPMMRAAFNDGAEYLVRINDDSEFVTSDWVSKAAAKLASYDPPNVGMVGPNCREGNTAIMTHDMVHRTHLDIFEHYYPDVFSAWWIDDWISKVYGPERSTKMMDWTVKHHTHKHGTRYEVQHHEANLLKGELKKGAAQIEVWLSKTDKPTLTNHPLSSLQKCTPKSNVPYRSQSNEDKAIIEQLYGGRPKCGGTIVEIGALDGVRYSNSWYFEHALQWKALLIEANPTNFKALETNRPNAINIHSAMCMGESIDFIGGGAVGGMVNTMSEKHGKKWVNPMEKSVSVPCQTFKPLFSKHGIIHVDIFILDVEGGEFEVLKTMDWSVTVGVWVVELDSTNPQKNHDVRKELRKHGYTPATWNIRDWCSKGGDCTANEVFVPLVSRPGKATCSKYSPSSKHAPSRYIWDANIEMIESSFYSPPIAVSKWSMDSHLLSALSKNHRIAYKEIVSSYQQANFDQKITALGKDFSHQRVATIKNAACDTSGLVVDSDNCLVFRNGGCDINKNSKFLIKDNAPKYDKVITIAMPWGSEPWHFVGEALVGLAYVQNIETYKIHVTAKTKFVLEWLRVVGVQEHQIITGTIFAKTLLIPELGKCGNPAPQQILWLQEKINSYLPDDGQDKHVLIVKRTKSRTQTNWADILNAAKQISPNVVVHDDSRLPSVQQQLENFRNAHTVIAPHGAGLLNIWASHPNTKVIEFMDASNMNLCYARLAYILGLNYNAIEMKSSMNRVSEVFQENAISHKISPQITNNFQIHVLTMNRATSLQRLLVSLENSEYGGENVDLYIHIDKSNDNQGCIRVAESFDFSHGDVTIEVAEQNSGLRDSWFNAWYPKEEERAVIFEDDMEVSPLWFKWLNKAWDAYSDRKDLAGISLQIQTLKAKNPHHNNWNPGSKGAFLYRIPGSWGFSPHPIQWKSFLDWIRAQDLNTLDVSTPGLITSDWWQKLDHRGMWTQYYIYFCVQHDLFTLYANLPERKTLTAHWREKGVHTPTSSGIDFPLASKVTFEFPSKPQKYDWDGEAIEEPVSRTTKPTLVITGMTRNDYKHQDATIKTIKRQMNNFDVIKVIIYENDSTDNTLNGLNTWSELLNIPVQIITQTNLKGSRTERFATGRNALIKAVEKISPEPDYMLLIDMDGVSDDLEGVETCFDLPEKWGVCCTNQRDVYYDLWVLRTFDNWCDCDVWYDSKCAVDRNAKFKYIPPSSPPIRVKSCFGGAALYNYKRKVKELIDKGAHYEADPVGHVFFHKSLRELDNDLELYIQPKMLNTAPVEHIPAPVRKREMKKKENFNTVPQTSSECPNGFQYHKSPQNLKYKASLRALPPWNWDMLQKKYDKKCQTQTSVKSQSDSIHLLSPLTDVVEKIKAASPTCKGGNCNNFLAIEVGTMFGTGTTKHLYQAISKTYNEFQLWTYEGMTERFCIAQNNLKELKHIYIVNELVMRNNILTCMVMPETGTVLSKPGGPSYSELFKKTEHEIQKGVIGGWFETYPVGRTADIVVIDSVRFTHVGIIEALNSANGLISSDTVFVMENDYWENTDELAILRKYFDLENVETLNTPGERWPWVTFKLK